MEEGNDASQAILPVLEADRDVYKDDEEGEEYSEECLLDKSV